jgi:hypothetical protein
LRQVGGDDDDTVGRIARDRFQGIGQCRIESATSIADERDLITPAMIG